MGQTARVDQTSQPAALSSSPTDAHSAADDPVDTRRRRTPLSLLQPIPKDRRPRRFAQLIVGLVLYGSTMALMVRSVLGLDPWDVFHFGIALHVPLSLGTVIVIASVLVLLLWIPLRQRPGIGTIANALIIGVTTDAVLSLVPPTSSLWLRIPYLVIGIVGNALAGALYIGAGLGPGPRDGLMTGIVARGIGSIRLVRTSIEVTVLVIGWVLGGTVGLGTVLYAVGIGPLLHVLLPVFRLRAPGEVPAVPAPAVHRSRRFRRNRSS